MFSTPGRMSRGTESVYLTLKRREPKLSSADVSYCTYIFHKQRSMFRQNTIIVSIGYFPLLALANKNNREWREIMGQYEHIRWPETKQSEYAKECDCGVVGVNVRCG